MEFNIDISKIDEGKIIFEFVKNKIKLPVNTYYYFLDNHVSCKDDERFKIILVLKKVISNWCNNILSIQEHEDLFLAFEFEDEYISFFKISNKDKINYSFQVVCSQEKQGYSFNPSEITSFDNSNIGFYDVLSDVFFVSKSDFLRDLNNLCTVLNTLH